MKKLAVIHTTPATIGSLGELIGELLPGCRVCNLLDDSILPEINQAGGCLLYTSPSPRDRG